MFDILDSFLVAFSSDEFLLFPLMTITFWVFHWAFRLGRQGY